MVPIIPAIPRSFEKKKFKEDVKSSKDEGGSGSPIRPISPQRKAESQEEVAVAQTQAAQSGALNGLDESDSKDDVQGNGVQEAVIEALDNAGSEKEVTTAESKSTFI